MPTYQDADVEVVNTYGFIGAAKAGRRRGDQLLCLKNAAPPLQTGPC